MIKVVLYEEAGILTAFEIGGHANSGPYGFDLVCAGVSAVSFGCVNAVMELCSTDLHIDQGADGGYLYVKLPKSMYMTKEAQLILKTMVVSLQTIEREYEQFIQIKKNEGGAPTC